MSTITINQKDIELTEVLLNQYDLLFYKDNPRVYSALRDNGCDDPTQQEIEDLMRKMEHVKELKTQIEQHGGLIEPLVGIKQDKEFIVLEGNSRLAAYRILAEDNPDKWSKVRVNLLPEDTDTVDIFSIIGTLHLSSKKDWSVFEKAAYVYRQQQLEPDCPIATLAKRANLSVPTVSKYLKVYKFMRNSGDTVQSHWNSYEQYILNKDIKKYRETHPNMDEKVIGEIKSGKIASARDIRDKMGKIAKDSGRQSTQIMNDYINGTIDLDGAFTRFEATGRSGNNYQKVKEIKDLLSSDDFQKALQAEAAENRSIYFELKKIKQITERIIRNIER